MLKSTNWSFSLPIHHMASQTRTIIYTFSVLLSIILIGHMKQRNWMCVYYQVLLPDTRDTLSRCKWTSTASVKIYDWYAVFTLNDPYGRLSCRFVSACGKPHTLVKFFSHHIDSPASIDNPSLMPDWHISACDQPNNYQALCLAVLPTLSWVISLASRASHSDALTRILPTCAWMRALTCRHNHLWLELFRAGTLAARAYSGMTRRSRHSVVKVIGCIQHDIAKEPSVKEWSVSQINEKTDSFLNVYDDILSFVFILWF